jgi:hypothetical protein
LIGRILSAFRARRSHGKAKPSRDALAAIDRLAPGNGQKPCAELRIPSEGSEFAIRGDERLLCDIIGLGGGAYTRQSRSEDRTSVPFDEFAERIDVASLRETHKVQVGGRGGLGSCHTICRLFHIWPGWKFTFLRNSSIMAVFLLRN